ncbi:GntR family transcriptional regulator [Actinoallomurus sp. CA-150999]|uniref:GntR family transcriptional regulator n=1 Tax=Actinoallomurus sp. CA-150999 TaxID=3239887 RepID=UPI003D927276
MVERSQGPRYRRIADDLRAKIDQKVYAADDQLPSEPELMEEYGVSRNTVRLALNLLANEGRIVSQPGRGTFVRTRTVLNFTLGVEGPGSEHDPEYRSEIEAQQRTPGWGPVTMRVLPATTGIADRLRIPIEDLVVLRQITRQVDGEPALIQRSYYPLDIALNTALTKQQEIEQGTIAYLAELGHQQIGYRDQLLARMPGPQETEELRLGQGVPVMELFRTANSAERSIRLTHTIFPADLFHLVYNVGDISPQDR